MGSYWSTLLLLATRSYAFLMHIQLHTCTHPPTRPPTSTHLSRVCSKERAVALPYTAALSPEDTESEQSGRSGEHAHCSSLQATAIIT